MLINWESLFYAWEGNTYSPPHLYKCVSSVQKMRWFLNVCLHTLCYWGATSAQGCPKSSKKELKLTANYTDWHLQTSVGKKIIKKSSPPHFHISDLTNAILVNVVLLKSSSIVTVMLRTVQDVYFKRLGFAVWSLKNFNKKMVRFVKWPKGEFCSAKCLTKLD